MAALSSCFPRGWLVCRWQQGDRVVGEEGGILTRRPPLCPERRAGLRAACQGSRLGNRYLWATGKVSHLRITHSQRRCVKKGCRKERGEQESGCLFSCSSEQQDKRRGRKKVTHLWSGVMLWLTLPSKCYHRCLKHSRCQAAVTQRATRLAEPPIKHVLINPQGITDQFEMLTLRL